MIKCHTPGCGNKALFTTRYEDNVLVLLCDVHSRILVNRGLSIEDLHLLPTIRRQVENGGKSA